MEPMLTQDDLKAIGTLVGEQIDEKVPKIIKDLVPPMIAAGIDDLEERMNVKFDAVQESLDSIEERVNVEVRRRPRIARDHREPYGHQILPRRQAGALR